MVTFLAYDERIIYLFQANSVFIEEEDDDYHVSYKTAFIFITELNSPPYLYTILFDGYLTLSRGYDGYILKDKKLLYYFIRNYNNYFINLINYATYSIIANKKGDIMDDLSMLDLKEGVGYYLQKSDFILFKVFNKEEKYYFYYSFDLGNGTLRLDDDYHNSSLQLLGKSLKGPKRVFTDNYISKDLISFHNKLIYDTSLILKKIIKDGNSIK